MNPLLKSLARYNRQEQAAILVGALALALALVWLLLLAPLQHKRDQLLTTNVATVQALGRVQLLASQIKTLSEQSAQAGASSDSIIGVINTSLSDNSLAMSGLQPSANGEVRVRIDKAAADAVLQWLFELETKHHLSVRELSITTLNSPGQVAVNVRLVKA
jgi:general secretion pathway protein M